VFRDAARLRPVPTAAGLALVVAACVVACGGDPAAQPAKGPASAAQPSVSAGPKEPSRTAIWFREEAAQRGLVFLHHSGGKGNFDMPEMPCAGAALFDMDGDGDLDAYLLESGNLHEPRASRPGNRLFRNRGDGTFEDVTEGSGADERGYSMGVACGDYDNDGDTDLYVTNLDENTLLRNEGGGKFTDVSREAGVDSPTWGTSTCFVDYDCDGDLDLYVACYLRWSPAIERKCDSPQGGRDYCGPRSYNASAPDILYRNDGNGRFTDVSEQVGLRKAFGNGLGVVAGDFDQDGRPDVFVANDGVENQLWIQQPDGTFRDEALTWGCAMDRDGMTKAGMGAVAIDIDDDSDLDLYVVNLVDEGDSVYRNEGRHFVDRTTALGLASASRSSTRFGIGLQDFDLDGLLDVYVATGRVTRALKPVRPADPYAEPDQVLRGLGNGRFEEVLPPGATEQLVAGAGRGAALGDVDGDGDVDVLVTNRGDVAHLFVNVAERRGSWSLVRVVNQHGADAIGATLSARVGPRREFRDVRPGYSYCSSNDPRIHFGLGDATRLEDVRVRWVDGRVESFGDLDGARVHTLKRGSGKPSEWVTR
jgi:hypothetical protein